MMRCWDKKKPRDKKMETGQNKQLVVGTKSKNDIWDKIKNGKRDKKTWVKMDNYVRKEGAREGGENAGVRGGP